MQSVPIDISLLSNQSTVCMYVVFPPVSFLRSRSINSGWRCKYRCGCGNVVVVVVVVVCGCTGYLIRLRLMDPAVSSLFIYQTLRLATNQAFSDLSWWTNRKIKTQERKLEQTKEGSPVWAQQTCEWETLLAKSKGPCRHLIIWGRAGIGDPNVTF